MYYAVWSRFYQDVQLCQTIHWMNSAMMNTVASNTLDYVVVLFPIDWHSVDRQMLIRSSRSFRCLNAKMVTWIQPLELMCCSYLVCLAMPNWILSSNDVPFVDSSCHLDTKRKANKNINLKWHCSPRSIRWESERASEFVVNVTWDIANRISGACEPRMQMWTQALIISHSKFLAHSKRISRDSNSYGGRQ